ncbi:MAG: hemolysin family protein [Oscillospiraceae bacterium]|nr:hemolysin family protein [Oscillospiraceae bacterium]
MEIALSSSNRTKVKVLSESGDKNAGRLLKALEEPISFFATTQLYITFITLFSGMYAAASFTEPIVEWVLGFNINISKTVAETIVFIAVTVILTYFTLIFGELIPKRIALRKGIVFALATIRLLNILSAIVYPFVKLLSISASSLLRLFGIKNDENVEEITKEELRMMLKSSSESGSIDDSELDILSHVLELDEKTVVDASVHRVDIVALPMTAGFDDVINIFMEKQISRLPIYDESIDNVKGIIHIKDILKYMVDNKDTSGFSVAPLLREPFFAPSIMKSDELLREMQKNAVYMAIIVDEHGGTVGIVTIEDLVEEIVGNISDEYDTVDVSDVTPMDDGSYIMQGGVELSKVQELFTVDLPVDEYETLSGFLIGQLRRIPTEDETPELEYEGLLFSVEKVHDKRIATVRVSRQGDGSSGLLYNP